VQARSEVKNQKGYHIFSKKTEKNKEMNLAWPVLDDNVTVFADSSSLLGKCL